MGTVGFGLGTGGGAGSSFTPTQISGLQLWLKADSLSLNDANPVSSWTDSSGNSNTATGSGTNRPLYKTSILNSLPVVRFDGSNDFLTVTRNAGLEPNNATLFALFAGSSAPGNSTYMLSKKHTASAASSYSLQRGSASTTGIRCNCRVATTGTVSGTTGLLSDSQIWQSDAKLIVAKFDGTNMRFGYGGQLISTQTASGNLAYDTNDIIIGAYDATQLYMAFDLAEVLIYNTALSAANVGKVSGYLTNKWGAMS